MGIPARGCSAADIQRQSTERTSSNCTKLSNVPVEPMISASARLLHETAVNMSRATHLQALFDSLAGTWALDRDLTSANASEPSGRCSGTAIFTRRKPSPVVDENGKLNLTDAEMLYHETGEFHLPTQVKVPFSKKYVWRFDHDVPKISIWFTKPGTDKVDYLFHNIDLAVDADAREARGSGGHLCVEDFYATSYVFTLASSQTPPGPTVASWETTHEVRGPKKDQVLTTRFTRR